jgi:hypothetical protein
LDQPGDWCFDTETQTVYFMPPGGTMEGTEVTVPVTDRLIELRATTGESVRHLRFRGLAFTQTLSVFPHFHPLHPDYVDCNRPNSGGYAVYLENAEHCAIEGCTFDQVGGDAIRLHGYSGHNRIVGNQIAGAGAQGICLADLDLWPYDVPPVWRDNEQALREVSARLPWAVGNLISQNHIHHCGAIDRFGAAIRLHGLNTDGNVISHNHVHDQPHHGIYLSTGFGQNIIEYNDLHALCRSLADAGGVYSNRWCLLEDDPVLGLGHVIRYNRIRDVMGVHPHARPAADPAATPSPDRIVRPHMTWGIYFDNSPRRALVHGNLCIGNTWGGVFLGGGYAEPEACVVENNLFVDSSIYQFDVVLGAHARDNCFRRNIVCYRNPDAALMRAGRAWKDGAASYAGWREFDRNLYWQAAGAPLRIPDLAEGTLDDWRALAFDRNSLVADPLFVDPAGGDYRLRPDSPALALGFAPLPVELMGITEETADMAAARAEAARRRRRLIYNDDGCGPIMQPGGGTREGFLRGPHSRLRAVAGSQVDSVFICSGASHVLNHRSAVAESYADVAERYGIGGEWELFRANLRALEALDTDPVQLTVDFCRDQGLEVVYSHRINDIHSQFLEVERSTWFREHPEYWINTPEDAAQAGGVNSPRHWWSALDFEQPAVLDYLVCVQQDVCGRYDVDGVETDYFRSPLFFRPNLDFRPATSAQLEILTQFQRRLQAVHRRAGAARGRPVLTIARVPATVATCCHVGIDIECWLHQGLLDVLTVGGGYLPFTEPLDELVALARTAGVPLYATISTSGMRGPENRYGTHEAWRGAAANMWHRGVDGIVTFNLFPSEPDPRFRDLGSVRTLAGQDKLFAIDCTRVLEGDLVQGIAQSQALPLAVPADGSAARAVLPVGDDLHAAHAAGTLATVELRVHLADPAAAAIVEVHLNGTPLAPAAPLAEGWLAFRPQAGWFRAGANELHFRAAARTAVPGALLTEVLHVELEVRYRGPAAARG